MVSILRKRRVKNCAARMNSPVVGLVEEKNLYSPYLIERKYPIWLPSPPLSVIVKCEILIVFP